MNFLIHIYPIYVINWVNCLIFILNRYGLLLIIMRKIKLSNIDELKSVIEKLGNNNSETKECLKAINTDLRNYLQDITPDEAEIESQIKRIVDIVKGDEHKYWQSNKFMTLYSNTKTDKKGWVKDFAFRFVKICKNLSEIKNFNESGQDNVKSSVIKELNKLDNEKNTGVSAYQISLILHCILPSYIPIFRLDKPDVFKIFKNENKKQKAEEKICNFSSNVASIYEFCESKDFPRGENNNGFDFALIDDAALRLCKKTTAFKAAEIKQKLSAQKKEQESDSLLQTDDGDDKGLEVKAAVTVDVLADKLIDDLKVNWKSPFEAPVVIFADKKVEQWFKLRWLQKGNEVLANLNSKKLDRFLFDVLAGEDKNIALLTPEMLRNVIISYLLNNYKKLDDAGVIAYLTKNDKLDEGRLFDFATVMANLFYEYELTRPHGLVDESEGFTECWQNEKNFFKSDQNNQKEVWQRTLYNNVIESINNNEKNQKLYTLPQLYNLKAYESFQLNVNTPVYLFGFSGMGQFYRVALRKLAENHKIKLFIQYPCSEFCKEKDSKNDSNNNLVNYWAKAGKDNLGLWRDAIKADINEISEAKEHATLLDYIRNSIINQTELGKSLSNNDTSLRITGAPSKLREIEVLHSRICQLLKDNKANINDILVMAPDIKEYKTAIAQVFSQSAIKAEEEKKAKIEKTCVNLPYAIVDGSSADSFTYQALETIFAISQQKSLTRPLFFKLVRNPLVQAVREIKPEEISNWEGWVSDMGVYRDSDKEVINKISWAHGVKRLLLAKLSNVEFDGISPYANIESSDNDSLYRFCDCIDSLEDWIQKASNDWKKQDLKQVFDFLNGWLLLPPSNKEFTKEIIVFKKVLDTRNKLSLYFDTGCETINSKLLSLILLTAAQGTDYSNGNLFVNGITFMKFAPNRSIPIKHLFLIGAGSDVLPGRNSNNTLDLRNSCDAWSGDETTSDKNKYAFLCQLMNTSESFNISYVNKNLQKDEDLYPSTMVNDLRNFINKDIWNKIFKEISIDETRDWRELYTARELRNKETLLSMSHSIEPLQEKDTAGKEIDKSNKNDKPQIVKIWQLKKFLQEPFMFQAEMLLDSENQEENPEKTEFEPIEVEFLSKLTLKKKLISDVLLGKIKVDDIEEHIKSSNILPIDDTFGQMPIIELEEEVMAFVNGKKFKEKFNGYCFKSREIKFSSDENKWVLNGTVELCAEKDDGLHIIEIISSKEIKPKDYLTGYITALALLSNPENKKKIFIDILGLSKKKDKSKNKVESEIKVSKQIELDHKTAIEKLNDIYEKAFIKKYSKILPIEFLDDDGLSFESYIDKLKDDGQWGENPWKYFSARKLFDVEKEEVCGFKPEDFDIKWKNEEAKDQKDLLLALINAKDESEKDKDKDKESAKGVEK